MRNIQIILNAILSKDIFEYILIDRSFNVVGISDSVDKYINDKPTGGSNILEYLPELVGSEQEIQNIFINPALTYILDSVHKNEYYINLSIEHYDKDTALILLHNITEITLSKQKLLQYSNESTLLNNTMQKMINKQNALLFVTNNEEITFANEQFLDYFSIKRIEDVRRKNLRVYRFFDTKLNSYDALYNRVNDTEEYIIINDDTFILQATSIESTHHLFTLTKVTSLTKEIETDPLTGTYRKKYFISKLNEVLGKQEKCSVVVIDLDDFKIINDTYGHQVGDKVLVEFTKLIRNNIRDEDTFARWGGEEFLLLLERTSLKNVLKKIERLRSIIENHKFEDVGHLTSSFGVSFSEETDDRDTILLRADKALYEAKANGKNKIVFKELE